MIFPSNPKEIPEGSGRVAVNVRHLKKLIKRLTPTGPGISHGPVGTSFTQRRGRGGGGTTGAASWL